VVRLFKIVGAPPPDSISQARLWEISENLHRAELDALERASEIAEWIALTAKKQQDEKPAQVAPVSGGRGNEAGVRAASRELGVDRDQARRSIKIANISPAAKDAARAAGARRQPNRAVENCGVGRRLKYI